MNLGLHQPDVSVAWDLGPHDFSILRYWLDETPTHVSALSRGCIFPHIPDVAFINLEFDSGTIAHVELSWLAPSKLRRTTVVGSRKMVVYDDTSTEPVRVFDSGVMVARPGDLRRVQADLPHRRHRLAPRRRRRAAPARDERLLRRDPHLGTPRSSAALGLEVVRDRGVDASLAAGGARVLGRRRSRPG